MKRFHYYKVFSRLLRKTYRLTLSRQFWRFQNRFFGVPCKSKQFVSLFSNISKFPCNDIYIVADRIVKGDYQFLGVKIQSEPIPNWHKDYIKNFVWPMLSFNKIRNITPKGVDLKNAWELSTFFHLFPIAVAYSHSKKIKYKNFIVNQINDWTEKNPCPFGVNWASPMSVALRLILIVEISCAIEITDGEINSIKNLNILLWNHILFILNNLENLSISPANHYIANIVGLLWGSLYFYNENILVSQINKLASKRLSNEIQRQVHSDGMNFEGSIGYHRLVTELFLYSAIIMEKNNITVSSAFLNKLNSMLKVLYDITLPNGKLPLIGDNDDCKLFWTDDYFTSETQEAAYLLNIGAAYFDRNEWISENEVSKHLSNWIFGKNKRKNKFLNKPASSNTNRSIALEKSQIYICKNEEDSLIINCIHPGQPKCGHTHNDTLSFILCMCKYPIIIDPGTYVYTRNVRMRNLFRSTSYHNVVQINGKEQWPLSLSSPFFIPKKLAPKVLIWKSSNKEDIFEGEHYGYLRLPEKIIHRRYFHFKKDIGQLLIRDYILSDSNGINKKYFVRIKTFFHISEEVSIKKQSDNITFFLNDGNPSLPVCRMRWKGNDTPQVKIIKALVSNSYGKNKNAEMLVFKTEAYSPYVFEYQINKIMRN